jgi:hypothetical protein
MSVSINRKEKSKYVVWVHTGWFLSIPKLRQWFTDVAFNCTRHQMLTTGGDGIVPIYTQQTENSTTGSNQPFVFVKCSQSFGDYRYIERHGRTLSFGLIKSCWSENLDHYAYVVVNRSSLLLVVLPVVLDVSIRLNDLPVQVRSCPESGVPVHTWVPVWVLSGYNTNFPNEE